jgi:hypothetical protein
VTSHTTAQRVPPSVDNVTIPAPNQAGHGQEYALLAQNQAICVWLAQRNARPNEAPSRRSARTRLWRQLLGVIGIGVSGAHRCLDLYRAAPIGMAVSAAREGTLWRCAMIAYASWRSF